MRKTKRLQLDKFYPIYVEMCKAHDFGIMPIKSIDEAYGIFEDDKLLYSIFVYPTFSDMALLGFPVSNKAIDSKYREGALDQMFNDLSDIFADRGYRILWTTSATERVIDSLKSTKFQLGDKNVDTYIKVLS